MAIALDPTKPFDYILTEDRDKPLEDQTVFKLKVLTARELANVEDGMAALISDTGEVAIKTGSQLLKILQFGLRGWENLKDGSGNDVPYRGRGPSGEPHPETLDKVQPHHRRELADTITEVNRLDEEEAKNSGSPSLSA